MDPRDYPSRYLHISGAFALGGTFTHVAPGVDVQIPTVAPSTRIEISPPFSIVTRVLLERLPTGGIYWI